MSDINWIQIEIDYISSSKTHKELSELYNAPLEALQKRAENGEWTRKRANFIEKKLESIGDIVAKEQVNEILEMQKVERVKIQSIELDLENTFERIETKSLADYESFTRSMERLHRMKYRAYNVPEKNQITGNENEPITLRIIKTIG